MRIAPVVILVATVCVAGAAAYFLIFSGGFPSSPTATERKESSENSPGSDQQLADEAAEGTTPKQPRKLPTRRRENMTRDEITLEAIIAESKQKVANPKERGDYIHREMLLRLDPTDDRKMLDTLKSALNKLAERRLSKDITLLKELSTRAASEDIRFLAGTLVYNNIPDADKAATERREQERKDRERILKKVEQYRKSENK